MSAYRIMIVEDQPEVSRLLHSALDMLEEDLDVVEILSAEKALQDCSNHEVDLLVADYRLPGMTGVELMQKMRHHHPRVKVILITGQTAPKIRKEVAEAGADAFFIKPVSTADFLDAVERHLGLVETSLPPEPIAPPENSVKRDNLPDLLAYLRQKLEAAAVLLISDAGRVLARAGDLPDGQNEAALLSSLLSIYSVEQKISHLIGQPVALNWHIFKGGAYDLIFAPLAPSHALLVAGKKLGDEARMTKTSATFAAARKTLGPILLEAVAQPPQHFSPEIEKPVEINEENGKKMEALLEGADAGRLVPAEVDDFWDKAAQQQEAPVQADMLSYDQARRLGLAPKDEF